MIAIVTTSLTSLSHYISRWWRQTWDTCIYLMVVSRPTQIDGKTTAHMRPKHCRPILTGANVITTKIIVPQWSGPIVQITGCYKVFQFIMHQISVSCRYCQWLGNHVQCKYGDRVKDNDLLKILYFIILWQAIIEIIYSLWYRCIHRSSSGYKNQHDIDRNLRHSPWQKSSHTTTIPC